MAQGSLLAEERELKLRPRAAALLDTLESATALGPFAVVGRDHERQSNYFFDTPGRTLRAARVAFRRRDVAGRALAAWTIKGPGALAAGISSRPEIEVLLAPGTPPALALGVLREAARQRGAPLLAEAVAEALAGSPPPLARPLLRFDTDRRLLHLEDQAHGWRVELALDRLALPGHPHFADLEIEAELKRGDEAALRAVEDAVRAHGEVTHSTGTKLQRVADHLAACSGPQLPDP
jgi:inorganic triphosphatase YgiF